MSKIIVTPSPHISSKNKTSIIMRDVVIALLPSVIVSVVLFGLRALVVELLCVASCVLFEDLSRKLMKKDSTISDWSAVVTGLLLALNLPATTPYWMAFLGSFFAIVVAKQLFGGIGQNFVNPALTGRIFLFMSFSSAMTEWVKPFWYLSNADIVTTSTPLSDMTAANTLDLFLGNVGGCIGETCAAALLIGGIYLVIRKVISPIIPCVYIGTVFVMTWALGENPVNQILAGGLILGAVFMATDYATSPITRRGKIVFALGCGIITTVIRLYGSYAEGVSFAILFMNILTPLIDRYINPRPFGTQKEKRGKSNG